MAMFLRTVESKGRRYLLLVENYRLGGRHRQRVIRSFGPENELDWPRVRKELSSLPGYYFLKES